MKITVETLRAAGSCEEALAVAAQEYPDGVNLSDWTRNEQLRVLRGPLRRYLGWA